MFPKVQQPKIASKYKIRNWNVEKQKPRLRDKWSIQIINEFTAVLNQNIHLSDWR